jgi:hypothetical protein
MAITGLNLPVDVPWKLIAVSPDMMDTEFGNKKFPFSFRGAVPVDPGRAPTLRTTGDTVGRIAHGPGPL